ncbi:MAG: triose-phosphate isomerase [Synechococcus sp. SB0673_bin_10]|nr:triose-phosphate isomerase [Synechococcus sp. SB0667_bin_8]MYF20540.1 triose-phosphate isomerase [Synechococcus sp. SB0677_bin_5]MYG63353.1 triose-phosphate isomerase [Synechococcus sp. SB0675_bin_7]MYI72686.1 triose-phosphate isomerase [Synechococcus sp. SB0673_bin_10]MYK07629.1 triose-phosphate isomerase [Synechococcus sp. SB0670_bin_20]MYK85855.1 triose-phosphate isomerase [Synechococcus sp. SB0669_bin_7]
MRQAFIAGNWKMHMTCAAALRFLEDFLPQVTETPTDRTVILVPPFTALSSLSSAMHGGRIRLGAQNVHWDGDGAYTGEISAPMLTEHGVRYVIVGHSEPRKYWCETDEAVNRRAHAAQKEGLTPILCIGESLEQRQAGETDAVIHHQVDTGLDGLELDSLVVAYEPLWAIGTGQTCDAQEANRICGLIRQWSGSPELTIQYGGSVKPGTIDELMHQSHIDGVLVGGASLDPDAFARIVNYQSFADG